MPESKLLLVPTLVVLFCVQALLPDAAAQPTADQLVERLKNKHESISSLQARFSQVMSADYFDEPETADGTLIMRGDSYRVETPSQTLVTDGVLTWIYNVGENQLLINDYVEDETTFSINRFFKQFDELYDVASVEPADRGDPGEEEHFVMTMLARSPDSFFRTVTIRMRSHDDMITGLEVVDANETHLSFSLQDIVLNPPVADSTFTFQSVEGMDVIDLRL